MWRDAAFRILLDHRPKWANEWVALQLDAESAWEIPLSWNHVRELMRSGVIERPSSDGYIRLLSISGFNEFDPERDADILDADVWRIFEVDTGIFDFFPEPKDVDRGKWQRGERSTGPGRLHEVYAGWPSRLYEWAHHGRIDRGRLIDAVLSALWRDFRVNSRSGLLKYLEIIEPTDDELNARQNAICELLRNENGPVVGLALKYLARLQKVNCLNVEKLLEAIPATFNIPSAAQPKSALSLMGRAIKNSTQYLRSALTAVKPALNHKSADVQELAVDLVVKWKEEEPALDTSDLLRSTDFLLAPQRRRLEEITGDQPSSGTEASPVDSHRPDVILASELDARRESMLQRLSALPAWVRPAASLDGVEPALMNDDLPTVFDPDPVTCPVLSGLEPIEPIRDVDELIDAVSHLFEVIDSSEELERIADGILRLGGETTENFSGKSEALRQTSFESEGAGQMVPNVLLWCLPNYLKVIGCWLNAKFPTRWAFMQPRNLPALEAHDQRFGELLTRLRSQKYGPVLATPTHHGGWIDPRTFVARVKETCELQLPTNRTDFLIGLLRLAPDFRQEALAATVELPPDIQRIIRYALGADELPTKFDRKDAVLWLAAGRARQPRGNLDELQLLGLSEREPNGITAATFQFSPRVTPQQLKTDRWVNRQPIHCVTVAPEVPNTTDRPTVALASRLVGATHFGNFVEDWQNALMASLWPSNPDSTLAFACHQLMMRLDDKGSAFEPVAALLAPLRVVDRGWSEMGRVALWLALLCRDDIARGNGIDVMIDGIADGRAHAGPLGKALLHVASGGWIKLNRLAESLREVTRSSILAERVVSEILDQLIASWETLPRDGHHVLALQIELLSSLGVAPSARTREVLSAISSTGKSAKLAKQLSALTADQSSLSRRQSALEAAQGRLSRAERIQRSANGR